MADPDVNQSISASVVLHLLRCRAIEVQEVRLHDIRPAYAVFPGEEETLLHTPMEKTAAGMHIRSFAPRNSERIPSTVLC